jgi:HEAT repeat protein
MRGMKPESGRPGRRSRLPRPHLLPSLPSEPPGETPTERVDRARRWISSDSPQERSQGLSILAAEAPEEATEPLFAGLTDSSKWVRGMAMIVLLLRDHPDSQGERIVTTLGGEPSTAKRFVEWGWSAGAIGSFGLTDRLLPHLDEIAHNDRRWRIRRRASFYARELREHPPGWPATEPGF